MKSSNKNLLIVLGGVVFITGIFSISADVLSAWSPDPRGMNTALSVGFEEVKFSFLNKPRQNYILGNYFATFIMPIFHLGGMYLITLVIKPLNRSMARAFFFAGAYMTAIGSGFHGTLAFVGDIVQSGNQELINNMLDYWQPWAYVLVIPYVIISLFLAGLIWSNKTSYSRWMLFTSPMGVMLVSTLIIAILPASMTGIKAFLAVTGLNLPLLVFYMASTGTLLKQEEIDLSI